jgi:hypothetical protein
MTITDRARLILRRLAEPRKSVSKQDAAWLCDTLIKSEVAAQEREREAQHWRAETAYYARMAPVVEAALDWRQAKWEVDSGGDVRIAVQAEGRLMDAIDRHRDALDNA